MSRPLTDEFWGALGMGMQAVSEARTISERDIQFCADSLILTKPMKREVAVSLARSAARSFGLRVTPPDHHHERTV